MSRICVLGGCGGIGSVAVKTLASTDFFGQIVIADKRLGEARGLAERLGPGKVTALEFDAADPRSVKEAVSGSSVVLNCVGPFYRFGPTILSAVIESGIDYVDVCDDLDATEKMLAMDDKAKGAGVSALIGMGNSPGMANVLARFCADRMLSEVESVDIYHVHGGEPVEGAAVIKHRIHAMTSDIPVFLDGKFTTVRMLEESGEALVEKVDFKEVGEYPVYPYPHPETITLPRYLHGVKRVANLGFVLPSRYFQLTMDIVKLGLCADEPLPVGGCEVIPIDFAVSFLLSRRRELLEEAGITGPMGCLKVVVKGKKDGESSVYVFSMYSREAGAGEGTGIPAAMGAILMNEGKITESGVFPPEAGVEPLEMLELGGKVIKGTGIGDEIPLCVEHIGKDGGVETLDISL